MRSLTCLVALFSLACGASSTLDPEDEITLYATSGKEDAEAPTFDRPPALFRQCDAHGLFRDTHDRFDENGDGTLDGEEGDAVDGELGPRGPHDHRFHRARFEVLLLVYDLDTDGVLSEDERAVVLEDFTVRCENLHDRLLAEFDADGDGELSPEEVEAAKAAIEERRPDPSDRPECDGEGPLEGLKAHFDADGDGELSAEELAVLREEIREHIRNGDPLLPPPVE